MVLHAASQNLKCLTVRCVLISKATLLVTLWSMTRLLPSVLPSLTLISIRLVHTSLAVVKLLILLLASLMLVVTLLLLQPLPARWVVR
ncbi:hypothetical protein AL050_02915 [Pseudomonas syringae pv. daphniphylli]|nr:hypothetical protein AL050_02915 [Pseudomonas syringae pv. daphniphylli]